MAVSTLDYVTFYSQQQWRIFPCKAKDKTPLVKWADEATTDMFQIAEWWSKYPDANVGLATGRRSGVFALDVDAGHGGKETLAAHIAKFGPFPPTPTSNTGGGGHHYLFIYPPNVEIRNSAGRLGQGLDVRGEGGYIVLPPSLHPSGKYYEWDKQNAPSKIKLAQAPDWLIHLLIDVTPPPAIRQSEGAYISGQRNNALTSLAGTMRRRGMTEDAIFLALNAENLNRCVPPLPESEIRLIAASVMRYNPQAAIPMQSKDRVTAEWSFCKTLYECQDFVIEYQTIKPEMFSDEKLRAYWTDVLLGVTMGQAAANAGILTELEKYNDWALPRLDDYAKAIEQFDYLARVRGYGWQLQNAAESGDTAKIDRAILDLNRNIELSNKRVTSITDAADEVEKEVKERSQNPVEVWGIPYAFPYLSTLTGGKQTGELIILAGEPKVGKSWFVYQDALQTAIDETPVYIWSGEMPRKQVMRRMYQLLGVHGRNMRTGHMTPEDWDAMTDARALVLNSPLYIDDAPMRLTDLRSILLHEKMEHGIKQFVIDYAYLVDAPGKDEIERTSNVSRTMKNICRELDLAGVLITSVNKTGMDSTSETAVKSNIRGSGQQIHDSDVVYLLTKFSPASDDPVSLNYKPAEYDKLVTLHIAAGRELDHTLPKGVLHYKRMDGTPKFEEVSRQRAK
jgi:replicative DNA helicase